MLNGLLFGFPLASTASLLLLEISRRRIHLSSESLSRIASLVPSEVVRAAVGRRFDAALWASLQPGRRWPLDPSPPADWTVDEVVDERNEPAHTGDGAVLVLVLVRTALRPQNG